MTGNEAPAASTRVGLLTVMEWVICAVASLGFAFDLYETLMLPLIVRPALGALGNLQPGSADFNRWVGLLFFVPSVAGGVFGLLGGYLTDLLGRRRVLVWSILLYGCSAWAASLSTSLPQLLLLRCTTLVGVCVEYVAAIAWLAELFPEPAKRESVLGYTQAFFPLGGLMVAGAYYLSVTYGEQLPAIREGHEAWRYTLLSGLIPALPLILVRPFLPESQIWREKRSLGTLKRPSVTELFGPSLRRTTLSTTFLVACSFALAYGAIQQTARMVPSLADVQSLAPRRVEQAVSSVQLFQEVGGIAGRVLFALLVVRIIAQRQRLRIFLVGALVSSSWLYFVAATRTLELVQLGIFMVTLNFNGLHSFWGNYLPRVYPTHLRGTGESFATNIGGRVIGVSAVLLTTQFSNVMFGSGAGARLAHSAGAVAVLACVIGLVGSSWLPQPEGDRLPE
jgi:MFS family permease